MEEQDIYGDIIKKDLLEFIENSQDKNEGYVTAMSINFLLMKIVELQIVVDELKK